MYMGLMKRGLLILSSLFLTIWMASAFNGAFFGFAIAIVAIAAFFDALNMRKRIISGEYVDDSVADITGFAKRFKLPIKLILLFAALSAFFGSYGHVFNGIYAPFYRHTSTYFNFGSLIPIILIIVFAHFIFGGKKRRARRDEPIDARRDESDYDQ